MLNSWRLLVTSSLLLATGEAQQLTQPHCTKMRSLTLFVSAIRSLSVAN